MEKDFIEMKEKHWKKRGFKLLAKEENRLYFRKGKDVWRIERNGFPLFGTITKEDEETFHVSSWIRRLTPSEIQARDLKNKAKISESK